MAGSIENGIAVDWQAVVRNALADHDVVLFNPRRDDWNPRAKQEEWDPYFEEQVNWELDHLDDADLIIFYFDPNTVSPITLLELGYHLRTKNLMVCCPDGYFRKGNVAITCRRECVTVLNTLDELIAELHCRYDYTRNVDIPRS
jgi:hypothetical protein